MFMEELFSVRVFFSFFNKRFRGLSVIAVCVGVCLLCAWAVAAMREEKAPERAPLGRKVDYTPIRGERHALRLHRPDFTYKCTECHQSAKSTSGRERVVSEHTRIALDKNLDDFAPMPNSWSGEFPHSNLVLEHGRNDSCFNCHNKDKRSTYIAHDGREIPTEQSEQLCAKCHGLTIRDHLFGAHGRRGGYWNEDMGPLERLDCVQCHDPHRPVFPQLRPLAGPRVGDPKAGKEKH